MLAGAGVLAGLGLGEVSAVALEEPADSDSSVQPIPAPTDPTFDPSTSGSSTFDPSTSDPSSSDASSASPSTDSAQTAQQPPADAAPQEGAPVSEDSAQQPPQAPSNDSANDGVQPEAPANSVGADAPPPESTTEDPPISSGDLEADPKTGGGSDPEALALDIFSAPIRAAPNESVRFFANYSNNSRPVNQDCLISFLLGVWTDPAAMWFVAPFHEYSRTFSDEGDLDWAVSCGALSASARLLVLQNAPPAITSTPQTSAVVGHPYTYAVAASDPDGDSLQFELLAAPAGMRIDDGGRLDWTPTTLERAPVALSVSDGKSAATQEFSIEPVIAAGNEDFPTQATSPQGFGEPVTILANVSNLTEAPVSVVVTVEALNITNATMSAGPPGIYTHALATFQRGVHAYTVYANSAGGDSKSASGAFEVTATLFLNIQTIKALYGDAERVTVTDPPEAQS